MIDQLSATLVYESSGAKKTLKVSVVDFFKKVPYFTASNCIKNCTEMLKHKSDFRNSKLHCVYLLLAELSQ